MKKYLSLALVCVVSSTLGSMLTLAVHTAPADFSSTETVAARSFVLLDERNQTRASLTLRSQDQGDPQPVLTLFDIGGTPKLTAGLDSRHQPFITLANSLLPNPDHKRISISVDDSVAKVELGHGQLSEILIQSGHVSEPEESMIRLRARNSSNASFHVDEYGHATVEVIDDTTKRLFREPEWRPLLPEGAG